VSSTTEVSADPRAGPPLRVSLAQAVSYRLRVNNVLPGDDFGVFTVGRLPRDPVTLQALEDRAERACRQLARSMPIPGAAMTVSLEEH
jgi:hypothetical protein